MSLVNTFSAAARFGVKLEHRERHSMTLAKGKSETRFQKKLEFFIPQQLASSSTGRIDNCGGRS
jgi:hypothetical protein